MGTLSERRERFAWEFARCGVVAEAAVRAGYSRSYACGHAYRLLEHPDVHMAICRFRGTVPGAPELDGEGEREDVHYSEVFSRKDFLDVLWGMVMATPEEFSDGRGGFREPERGSMGWHGVAGFKRVVTEEGERTEVRMVNRLEALRLLAKSMGWDYPVPQPAFGPRVECAFKGPSLGELLRRVEAGEPAGFALEGVEEDGGGDDRDGGAMEDEKEELGAVDGTDIFGDFEAGWTDNWTDSGGDEMGDEGEVLQGDDGVDGVGEVDREGTDDGRVEGEVLQGDGGVDGKGGDGTDSGTDDFGDFEGDGTDTLRIGNLVIVRRREAEEVGGVQGGNGPIGGRVE